MVKIACLLLRLYVRREKNSLDFYCMDVPMLVFAAWLVQEPYEGEFPNLFPNLLRLSPNFSPNFL